MNEIITVSADSQLLSVNRTSEARLSEIEANIHTLKRDVAHSLIEIGKNLIEAKSLVRHGEWAIWLENNVGFSQRTAQNYMKMARTFSGLETNYDITRLDASKLFLLQEMSSDARARFLEDNDVENMSVREMKAEMRRRFRPNTDTEMKTAASVISTDYEIVDGVEDPDVWSIFDKEWDGQLHRVPVRLLKPIERYEELFGPRLGEEYDNYLKMMEYLIELLGRGDKASAFPVIVTKDLTVLDEQEIVRAYRDLGIEEIDVKYATASPYAVSKGMTIEELKIYESMSLHVGRWMDAGRVKLSDSRSKFRAEMLKKGIDVI